VSASLQVRLGGTAGAEAAAVELSTNELSSSNTSTDSERTAAAGTAGHTRPEIVTAGCEDGFLSTDLAPARKMKSDV
jgi:hypothetical protein